MRWFWRQYYRFVKWYRYRTVDHFYKDGVPKIRPSDLGSPDGVQRVPSGYRSRPMPIPTHVKSSYWQRVVAQRP